MNTKAINHWAAGVASVVFFSTTDAQAIDKFYDPFIQKGVLELEYSSVATQDSGRNRHEIGHGFEVGYGFTDHWQAEVGVGHAGGTGRSKFINEIEFENKFQFTPQGEQWLDSGLLVSYSHALISGEADGLKARLLLQKDFDLITNLANLGLAQDIGAGSSGGPELSFNWNTRYRLTKYFQPGIELQSDFGQTHALKGVADQVHLIGPSAFGKLFSGTEYGAVKYQVAYLAGLTDASPDTAARLMLEYKVYF